MGEETVINEAKPARTPDARVWVMVVIILLVVAVAVIAAVILTLPEPDRGTPSEEQAIYWPTEKWTFSSPEEEGIDPSSFEEMMAYIDKQDMEVHSIVAVRHGQIVFEEYFDRHFPARPNRINSATKSVTSMLVGIAIHQGYIEGVEVPVAELLPGYSPEDKDPRKELLTLEHLLTMSDGLDWNEHDIPYEEPENIVTQMWASDDPVQFVLDRPMVYEPGEVWAYNSGASMLLGVILEEATGRDLVEYAMEVLFRPIGIGHIYWEKGHGDHYLTGGGLHLKPRDMARLGYLMLHNGNWNGQQIVPAGWVTVSTASHKKAEAYFDYGYQWWILPDGLGYAAQGLYGQQIVVLPEADMIVVTTAGIPSQSLTRIEGLIHRFILPACTDLPQRPERKLYDAYGFTFEYPSTFFLDEKPILGQDTLSDASGMIQITSMTEPQEILAVIWFKASEAGGDERAMLDVYLTAISEDEEMIHGDYGQGEQNGRPMPVRFSEMILDEGSLSTVSGAWICDRSDRGFAATYTKAVESSTETLLADFQSYVEGVSCD